jgi:hypothetical protein
MADASGISHVTESVQALLRAAITNASGPMSGTQIDLRSPKEIGTSATKLVSLWMYRVDRFDELINTPPVRLADGRISARPLPLNLYYLITPIGGDPLTRQRLLGLAMQALHMRPRLDAEFLHADLLKATPPSISIHLEQQTAEETVRIWHAMHEPYALSAAYLVQYVPIESSVPLADAPPVLDKAVTYAAIRSVR